MPRRRKPPRAGAIGELPPLRILSQIAATQGIYYATALILFLFTGLVAGTGFHMDLVFGWASLRGDTTQGFVYAFIWLCCSAVVAVALVALVARSKLVPDFVFTLHFLHLCIVTLYTGFLPRNFMWWATNLCSIVATIAMAMWGCQWRELRPINFGGNGGRATGGAAGAEENGHAGGNPDGGGMGDEEMGFGRGRGRGRGRDGQGEYELASIREQEGN
ncbi:hypothetical protein PG993_000298 [Apiospora rasikravindrae]|uniref:Integral membrane protein n=1 Tax=Apiospora rasikravindrae TaxID=990691 RepID=A0ABR1UAB0_9PEZI